METDKMESRDLIDYAASDDGANFRSALYAAIHDRVSDHIEAKKQEIAQSLIVPQEESVLWPGTKEYKAKHPDAAESKFDKKKVSTGTVHTKKAEKPKDDKDDLDEEFNLEDYSPEQVLAFMQTEEFDELDLGSKIALGEYSLGSQLSEAITHYHLAASDAYKASHKAKQLSDALYTTIPSGLQKGRSGIVKNSKAHIEAAKAHEDAAMMHHRAKAAGRYDHETGHHDNMISHHIGQEHMHNEHA